MANPKPLQKPASILSIQSWVSFGHVGNAAALFPLQRLGFEVWAIHTVQFSNHTGYESWKGMVLPPEHLTELVQAMADRGAFADCRAVLSGYMGSGQTADAITHAVAQVREEHAGALYCCDPVMGDSEGGIFVHPEIPEVMKRQVMPLADIITPNQFELELLSGQSVKTLAQALIAAQMLREQMHQKGPRLVLVTSLIREDGAANSIETLAVSDKAAFIVKTPLLALEPPRNGTGDLIAALFLGNYLKSQDLARSLEKAVSALYGVLELSQQLNTREIQLVAAQEEYLKPSKHFKALRVLPLYSAK